MRVLHLLKTSTGATWALRQTRELVAAGIDVHVALPDGPLCARYAAAGVTVHRVDPSLPLRRPREVAAALGALRRVVEEVSPDLIHSHFVTTTLAARLALGRRYAVPRLFQVPGPLHLEHLPFRAADLLTAGPNDYWIASCRWTAERYRRSGVRANRIFLSYYGSDCAEFAPQPPGQLRRELGIAPETRIVGMVAYVYPPKRYLGQRRGIKGHEDLIDAVASCLARGRDLVCVIVGGAWHGAEAYAARLHEYARSRCGDRVRFLGTRSDVAALYADFDVAVHPSHSENLGGAAESLLLGVPTIATEVGGFPDIVRPGDTGWLVPPRRPDRLAAAILEVLDGPAEAARRARRGRALARATLDVKVTAGEIRRIYAQVTDAHAAALPVVRRPLAQMVAGSRQC